MTGKELLEKLCSMSQEELSREFAVRDAFNGVVFTDIAHHQVSLEKGDVDSVGDSYPDCIMVSIG